MENSIQDRLSAHRLLAGAPPDQLAWLAARGRLVQLEETRRAEARDAWPKVWKKLEQTL